MRAFLLLLTLACTGLAVDLTREEAAAVKTFDLEAFEQRQHELAGKVVKVRFNHRGEIGPIEGGKARCVLSYYRYDGDSHSGNVAAIVPANALPWLRRITTDMTSKGMQVVFAKVVKDEDGDVTLHLLGREMRTDARGSKIVW